MADAIEQLDKTLAAVVGGRGIVLNALAEGGRTLQQMTVEALLARLPRAQGTSIRNPKPMSRGVRVKVDRQLAEVKVSIMGDYRLKWFEMGIAAGRRRTRKGADRGGIKALRFFAAARGNEGRITAAITQSLDRALKQLQR